MLRNFGVGLCLGLALAVSGCPKKSHAPQFDFICIGDGFGGADCSMSDGSKKYMKPSELKNVWITNQASMERFAAWCYDTDARTAAKALDEIRKEIEVAAP